jgi:hypothetical protein
MTYKSSNFALSTLAVGLTDVGTTLQVQNADKDKFPVIGVGETTRLIIGNAAGAREIVEVTARSAGSASMTITRAVESVDGGAPVALAWNSGDFVMCALTAGVVTQTYTHPSVSSGAHAASAISVTPTGGISSPNVQAALAELDSEKAPSGHSHSAGAISVTPTADVDSTDVQNALAELGSEKAPKTGVGASGTWPISITGSAASAGTATTAGNGHLTGEVAQFLRSTAPSGWLALDGKTIGNGASGATGLAGTAAEALFLLLWAEFDNTILPIQDSAGTPTTRGASAAADFAANKRLPIHDFRGYFPRGAGTNGDGAASGALGVKQADSYLNHAHTASAAAAGGHSHTVSEVSDTGPGLGPLGVQIISENILGPDTVATSAVADHTHAITVDGSTTGGTETRPKNIAVLFCVKL